MTTDGLFRSTDNGDNWTLVNSANLLRKAHVLAINESGHIFAGVRATGDREGVYRSTDNGNKWTEFNDGLTAPVFSWTTVVSFAFNDSSQLFAGVGGGGVFRTASSTTAVEDIAAIIPNSFVLHQNYPNPFNPETTIAYGLPEETFVNITVFNVVGQKVRTLFSGKQSPGFHKLVWNGKDDDGSLMPSGMYVYRLKAGEFSQTRKLALLR